MLNVATFKLNGYQTCCELMGVTHGVKTREESEEAGIQWMMGELAFGGGGILSHCARRGNRTQPRFRSVCRDAKTDKFSASEKKLISNE